MTEETFVGFSAAAGRLAWIDFEASSLNPGSFPTEVGWAFIANGAVVSGALLIRPLPEWLAVPSAWSAESERLTGISLAMLDRDGHPVAEVVKHLTAAVSGRLLLSDNPEFDGHWLKMLFNAAGVTTEWTIEDIDAFEVATTRASPRQIDRLVLDIAARQDSPIRHRAEPDARRPALRWGMLAGLVKFPP